MASVLASPSVTIPAMDCVNCKREGAKLVCSTCGTFYCNVLCQAKHWPAHRDLCMPRLVMASPLLGTAVYLEQCMTPSKPKGPNMTAKPCNDKPIPPNTTSNSSHNVKPNSNVLRQNSNGIKNKQNSSPNNGRKGSPPHTSAAATCASKENVPSNTKQTQQKMETIVNKANDTNAKVSSMERYGQKDVGPFTEIRTEELSVSRTAFPKANVDNYGQKNVGATLKKKMEEKPFSAAPKANSATNPTTDKQMPKPVAPAVNDIKAKIFNTQSNIRSAVAKANDQKTDNMRKTQHLQQAAFPDPGSKVMISYVADDRMYIYETGSGLDGAPNSFELLIARSIECSRTVQSYISAPPTVEDIVFAAYDGDYFRAVVKSISIATVEVFFPDFGNTQTVQWNTLKEIPDPKIKYANCLTHPVWIQNVPSFTMAMKKFLNQQVDVTEFMLYTVIDVQNSSTKMVEMYQCSEQYYLSVKLQNFNLQPIPSATNKAEAPPQPKSPQRTSKYVITNPNTYKPVYIEELIDANTIEGEGIELVIINASESQLSVVPKTNFTLYTTMLKDSDVYGKIDPNPYEPKENEVCLIKRDDFWYRAVTLQTVDAESNFYLLDELQCVGSDAIDIRRYPPGLTRQQFVVECVVENTDVLLEAMEGCVTNADTLSGSMMTANVYQSQADEDTYETTHLNIVSIRK